MIKVIAFHELIYLTIRWAKVPSQDSPNPSSFKNISKPQDTFSKLFVHSTTKSSSRISLHSYPSSVHSYPFSRLLCYIPHLPVSRRLSENCENQSEEYRHHPSPRPYLLTLPNFLELSRLLFEEASLETSSQEGLVLINTSWRASKTYRIASTSRRWKIRPRYNLLIIESNGLPVLTDRFHRRLLLPQSAGPTK
jgi:hypothetical protein